MPLPLNVAMAFVIQEKLVLLVREIVGLAAGMERVKRGRKLVSIVLVIVVLAPSVAMVPVLRVMKLVPIALKIAGHALPIGTICQLSSLQI